MAAEEAVRFRAGALTLEGRVNCPPGATRGLVVCHPHPLYGGTMDHPIPAAIAERGAAADIATLRFNFRGAGASEGSHDGGAGEVDDLRGALAYLVARTHVQDVTLAGYSFGALIALLAGHDAAPPVRRLVAVAPPIAMADVGFMRDCSLAKLFVVAAADEYCPADRFATRFAEMPEPKRCVALAGTDHFLVGSEGSVADLAIRFALDEG